MKTIAAFRSFTDFRLIFSHFRYFYDERFFKHFTSAGQLLNRPSRTISLGGGLFVRYEEGAILPYVLYLDFD